MTTTGQDRERPQLLLPLEATPQELLRLPLPLAAPWLASRPEGLEVLEQLRWAAEAAHRIAWGQFLATALPEGSTAYDTVARRHWYMGTTWVSGDSPQEARERHDSWVAAGCPNPRRDCQPSAPGYRTREAREARAAAAAAEKERKMDEKLSTRPDDPLAMAVLAAHQSGAMAPDQVASYLRKPSAWKLCSGAPSLGVAPHPQLREQFARDDTADGLYRMCKPCDSVTQRAYRIRLKLRAQGLAADNLTVRAILETPALMPSAGKAPERTAVREAVAAAEQRKAPPTPRVPIEGDPVVVLGVKYRIKALGPQSGLAQLRTSFGGRTSSCRVADLSWDKVAGVWRVEDGSAALAVAQVAPEPAPAPEPATRPAPKPSKSTPEQRARWAAAKREQRARAGSR